MNDFRYIVILLAVCSVLISCEREEDTRHPAQNAGKPISFTAESIWPDITKAPVNNLGDILNDGFRVWGAWTKDPDDNSYFVGDYATGTNGSVFGADGTAVRPYDADGNMIFDPEGTADAWTYDNVRDWYRGYYSFAAILPNSLFDVNSDNYMIESASLTSTFSQTGSDDSRTLIYDNALTLTFPDDRLVLGGHVVENDITVPEENQKDIMIAFSTEDNSDYSAENVSLNFTHIFARLGVELTATDSRNIPDITTVTIYGIHKTLTGPLKLTQKITQTNYRTETSQTTVDNAISMRGDLSTIEDPYAKFTMPEGHYNHSTGQGKVTLFKDLIVLPENLSEEVLLQIRVDFNKVRVNADSSVENLGQGHHVITIDNGTWHSGEKHLYSFVVDGLDLNGLNNN